MFAYTRSIHQIHIWNFHSVPCLWEIANYHPSNHDPVISKTTKRIAKSKIMRFLELHNALHFGQHIFLKPHRAQRVQWIFSICQYGSKLTVDWQSVSCWVWLIPLIDCPILDESPRRKLSPLLVPHVSGCFPNCLHVTAWLTSTVFNNVNQKNVLLESFGHCELLTIVSNGALFSFSEAIQMLCIFEPINLDATLPVITNLLPGFAIAS